MKYLFLIILFLFITQIFSQEKNTNIFNELSKPINGNVKIFQDPKVKIELDKHLKSFEKRQGVEGYRIQIFFGSGKYARDLANKSRIKFISDYTDKKAYMLYFNPYWKVRIGNFRNQSEANLFLEKIKEEYPDAFIVKDIIEVEQPN